MIVAVLAVLFLFVSLPFSSRTQEEDLRYTYRMGPRQANFELLPGQVRAPFDVQR